MLHYLTSNTCTDLLTAWNSLPKASRAVTNPGLFRKRLKTHFLAWLSVSADDNDDSVMHLWSIIVIGINLCMMMMMMMMTTMMIMMYDLHGRTPLTSRDGFVCFITHHRVVCVYASSQQPQTASLKTMTLHSDLRQVVRTYEPLSPSSTTWYWPNGGDALRMGWYHKPGRSNDSDQVADLHGRRGALRSASSSRLVVPMFWLSTVNSRTFNVSGPRIWNGLPEDVASAPTFSSFWRRFKPFLFQQSYPDIII